MPSGGFAIRREKRLKKMEQALETRTDREDQSSMAGFVSDTETVDGAVHGPLDSRSSGNDMVWLWVGIF